MKLFKYEEKLPVRLNGYTNLYEYDTFCFTNMDVHVKNGTLYRAENKNTDFLLNVRTPLPVLSGRGFLLQKILFRDRTVIKFVVGSEFL